MHCLPKMKKSDFIRDFKQIIMSWVEEKEADILHILEKGEYLWDGKNYENSVKERDRLELAIRESRKRNNGAIDLQTLDEICIWGFRQKFPLRDPQETIRITKEGYFEAIETLLNVSGVGISRASKIIGLSDQKNLCICDSRVGNALKDLKKENVKLILCPPDRGYKRDFDQTTRRGWAANYERLIWTIEIIQECFKKKSHPLRAADIEMALFVMGK
jgi:hypothetical protein